ncbi:M42 family metallopeptidase [Rossellomorea vietnamensis]|jgi:putative aminopeptidase FrvX|uniref:M42 family metallopeptidase n=1 Tax=Rossellomorea vietnamensis TaxID=218284 RepID=UPI000553C1D5
MNLNATLSMLKDLTDANGIPGNEREPRNVMKRYIEPYSNQISTDNLGSLIAKKIGDESGPSIMIAGHLDEVGFMVTNINKHGFLQFETVGYWWSQVMLAQKVTISTRKGKITGVIGSKPPHILTSEALKGAMDIKDMFIDIGASSKEEAQEWGVRPGDMITPSFEFTPMKNKKLLLAKAWDNRMGCAIAIDVLRQLKDAHHPNIVYSVGTVQEEVGLRGARTSAAMIEPDIAFGVDVGIAGDTPGISKKESLSELGKGPQIILYDSSMVSHKGLRDLVINTAEESNIPFQLDTIAGGSTDSGAIHLTANGVPSLTITVPTRYIHSHAALLHYDDYVNTVKLITDVVKRLDRNTFNEIINS